MGDASTHWKRGWVPGGSAVETTQLQYTIMHSFLRQHRKVLCFTVLFQFMISLSAVSLPKQSLHEEVDCLLDQQRVGAEGQSEFGRVMHCRQMVAPRARSRGHVC